MLVSSSLLVPHDVQRQACILQNVLNSADTTLDYD